MGFRNNKTNKEVSAAVLLTGLDKLRKEERYCDITLKVGKKTIRAHKNVLSVYSPYFMTMFSGRFLESGEKEISIEDVDADCLEVLIDYMYTGNLNLESTNVNNILLAASFLQINGAEELCCELLIEKLSLENCIEYLVFAGKNFIKHVVDPAIELITQNFHHIYSKNDYLEIDFDEFQLLTRELRQSGQPDDLLCAFVMRWINYSYHSRIEFVDDFLELLDALLISPEVLHSLESMKMSNPKLTAWITRENVVSSTKEIKDHILVSHRIGKYNPLRISLFSESERRQIHLLPGKITDGSYVCNGYYIYHQGGWRSTKELLTDSFVYNPIKCKWIPFVPLQVARAYHRSCVLNGSIYSVGGSNGIEALSSVEFVNLYTGQRAMTKPLPIGKERAGLALEENSLYVVGGTDRGKSYSCIHRMDVREGVWQELASSPYRAGASSCALIEDSIYTTHEDTLQRYDIRTNSWSMMNCLYKRYPQEVFAVDNGLFGLFSDYVGKFIPEERRWVNQRTLKCNLQYLQVSANLRFPNVYENNISDPIFQGVFHPPLVEIEDSSDDDIF